VFIGDTGCIDEGLHNPPSEFIAISMLTDIPRIAGLRDAIFRLSEARRNEIRSQPTGWQPK
jgi:hypothetical protein